MTMAMRVAATATAILLTGAVANGQSFNIDIGSSSGAPGTGAPATTFGAAAQQPGTWNNIIGNQAGAFSLVGLNGAATGVTFTRSSSTGHSYGFNNPNTSGNFALLLDDAHDIGVGNTITYTFNNLAAGNYQFFVYAAAPDSATTVTSVRFPVQLPVISVSGAVPVNSFVENVTHAVLERLVLSGTVSIQVASTTGAGRCNGIQVVRRQFVRQSATGTNDGTSWTNAYTDLQSALNAGAAGQVWVAAGTYKPAASARTTSFQLQNYLSVFGGFAGTENRLGLRKPATNVCVLSGDIGLVPASADNSYHVVEAAATINATARLDGFTIVDGRADGASPDDRGGGLLLSGAPTIRNCTFANNTCTNGGGGVYSTGAGASLVECVVRSNSNSGNNFNGGGIRLGGGSLTLINCFIAQNTTSTGGGGLAIASAAATVNAYNCIFNNNNASTNNGGAIISSGTLTALNCTFVNNVANNGGGGGAAVRISGGTATLTNCLLRNNSGANQISNSGTIAVTFCNVPGGFTGTSNVDVDPRFADADGPDNVAGNLDDDLRLTAESPCINAGTSSGLPNDPFDVDGDDNTAEIMPWDHRGRPRVFGPIVDIGAFEMTRVYVKSNATGVNDGSNWANAFPSLMTALSGSFNCEEVWVASGTYVPSPSGLVPLSLVNFQPPTGTTIYGGFAGTESSLSQRNIGLNPVVFSGSGNLPHVVRVKPDVSGVILDGVTIRDGRDQIADPEGGSGLLCHGSAALRNCTITGNIEDEEGGGGGIRNLGNLTLESCEVSGNQAARDGAGIHNAGQLFVDNCILRDNRTTGCCGSNFYGGGGIHSIGSLTLTRCVVRNNGTGYSGAGLFLLGGPTLISKCTFVSNSSLPGAGDLPGGAGGAVYKWGNGSLVVENSVFLHNEGGHGGGIFVREPGPLTVRHCTFFGNTASYYPGGLAGALFASAEPNSIVVNSIFWANTASGRNTQLYIAPTATLSNCVVSRGLNDVSASGAPGPGWTNNLDIDPRLTPDGRLRSNSPCINAGASAYAAPVDIDGEARPAGSGADIGADEYIDTETIADGLPDAWELRYFNSTSGASAGGDSDGDLFTNSQEYNDLGTAPNLPPIYMAQTGNDGNPGTSSSPKLTLQGAFDVVAENSTIRIAGSATPYTGTANIAPNTFNKRVALRGAGSSTVTFDCGGQSFFGNPFEDDDSQSLLYGLTIANAAPLKIQPGKTRQLRTCVLLGNPSSTDGRAINASLAHLTVSGGSVSVNPDVSPTDLLSQCQLHLAGNWTWNSGTLDMRSSTLYGDGSLTLGSGATLAIKGYGAFDGDLPTVSYADIRGTGNITIDPGQELRLVNGATIDLSGASGSSACSCPATLNAGTVTVNGKLIASGGRVQNTNVVVNQGDIGDGTFIVHNDISLPQTVPATASTAGFGGEFFVENDSTICCNHIVSYGDRYLDIDPNPDPFVPNPVVQNNTIDVIITQATADGQGELLELRAYDYDSALPCSGFPAPCAIQLGASAGYNDTWTLNKLEIMPGGRVTLTNRKNFDFNANPQPPYPPIPTRDTVYVRKVVLHPNAVLNIGLQRLYYMTIVDEFDQTLTASPTDPTDFGGGRRIVDVPLLGFSLKVINFEDETAAPFNETDIRLRTRVQDDPSLDPDSLTTPLGSVGRVTWNGRKGLSMDTQVDGHPSVSMVAIKGSFARAGEDEIEVSFIYDWRGLTPSSSRLRVYLSDSPEVGQNLGPLLATISPPTSGSGTVTGVSWATFAGKFPRGNLDLRRGTFIELQLTGNNAHITIDDFDPLVCGSPTCGDIGGDPSYDWTVSGVDFLYLLAEQGKISGGTNYCADLMSGDKYVDLSDLLLWDSQLQNVNANLCQTISSSPAALPIANVPATLPSHTLLVAGKSAQLQTQLPSGEPDRFPALLFGLDPGSASSGDGALPPGALQIAEALGHGRLARNASGALFQLHGGFGLMRLSDGAVVAPRGDKPCANPPSQVHVGFWTTGDVPLLDAAFDRTDPSVVYVTPVHVVDAANPAQIYHASARIKLLPTPGAYNVERLYGQNPYAPGASNTEPPMLASVNVQHQREIETDGLGNLFALSAMSTLNNDNNWLLLYRASDAFERRILLPSTLAAPSAMLVTSDNQKLYIAAGLSGTSSSQAKVYRFTIVRSGNEATGVTLDNTNGYTVSDMRQVTALAEGLNGAIYAVGFQAPTFDVNHAFANDADLFTTPAIAQLPAAIGSVTAQVITGGNLALPISVVLANTGCPGPVGDFNGDQVVNAADVPGFVNVMLNGAGGPGPTLCRADFNADQQANGRDISGFVQAVVP